MSEGAKVSNSKVRHGAAAHHVWLAHRGEQLKPEQGSLVARHITMLRGGRCSEIKEYHQKPKNFMRKASSYRFFAAFTLLRILSSLKWAASHLSTSATE